MPPFLYSLTIIKQTAKVSSAKFQKMLSPSYVILKIQRLEGKSVDLDEVMKWHTEPPHHDLRCLQIQLYLSLILKDLANILR